MYKLLVTKFGNLVCLGIPDSCNRFLAVYTWYSTYFRDYVEYVELAKIKFNEASYYGYIVSPTSRNAMFSVKYILYL